MFEAFVTLFSQADFLFYILFFIAMGMFIVEVFIPSFGIVGIGGVLMSIGAITERCLHGENSANEILLYIFYSVILLVLSVFIARIVFICVKTKSKTKYVVIDGYKVPLKEEGNPDYSFLIGKEGEVVSDLKPSGKVRFEEGTFEVTSSKEYIYSGTRVKADKIVNQKVVVKKIG